MSAPLSTPSQWIQKLAARPLVEIRRGISLEQDAPEENSSVLALTAPSGRYVDIRFSLSPGSALAIPGNPSNTFNGYATAGLSIISLPKGTASCVPYDCTIHVKWEHPIDSSRSFTTDGADMYLMANGDTIEIGTMVLDGKVRMFKEYWTSPQNLDLSTYMVVQTKNTSVDEEGHGMAVRIGNFLQGVLQTKTEFWLERWEQKGEAWEKDPRSNTDFKHNILPCRWMTENMAAVGSKHDGLGTKWEVVESSKTE